MSDISVEDLITYRDDPVKMVADLFGAVPDPRQEVILRAFPSSPRLAIQAAAGVGTTACLAWLAWNFLLTRIDARIGVTCVPNHNLHEFWNELKKWHDVSDVLQNRFEFTRKYAQSKERPDIWRMDMRPLSGASTVDEINERLIGVSGDHIMWIIDHAEHAPSFILTIIKSIFQVSDVDARIIIGGTPSKHNGSIPYQVAVTERDAWNVIKITSDPDSADRSTRVPVEYARQQIEQYGRDCPLVINNILGEFLHIQATQKNRQSS
jgi:hypothetical protein